MPVEARTVTGTTDGTFGSVQRSLMPESVSGSRSFAAPGSMPEVKNDALPSRQPSELQRVIGLPVDFAQSPGLPVVHPQPRAARRFRSLAVSMFRNCSWKRVFRSPKT